MHRKYACAMLRKEGISSGQPPLFEVLAQNEGSTQCELSRQCLLEPATITSTLTLMERDGLIDRRPDSEDRRIRRIYLTKKGFQKSKTLSEVTSQNARVCFEGLTDDECETFYNISQKIINNINTMLNSDCESDPELE